MQRMVSVILMSFIGATTVCATPQQECPEINSTETLIQCVLQNAPEVQDARLYIQELKFGIQAASQSINPRLEVYGGQAGGQSKSMEFGLYHTIELGGKIDRRINKATSAVAIANAQLEQTQQHLILVTRGNLLRMRQIKTELQILDETLRSFQAIIVRFKHARGLSPGQEASITAFSLASREAALHQKTLENEQELLIEGIELSTGVALGSVKTLLTPMTRNWARLSEQPINAPSMKVAQAKIESDQAEVEIQKSLATGNLEIGPRLTVIDRPAGQETQVGFGVLMPLSLYHSNQGGRLQAKGKQRRSEKTLDLLKNRLRRELKRDQRIYRSASKAFKSYLTHREINKKHDELHHLIKRGLINASIIIEVHRQFLAYQQQLHQLETEGMAAYWQIQQIEGKLVTKGNQ